MKNTFKFSALATAILAMASVSAFAANSTTANISLTATVSSFDNITCTQSSVDLNSSNAITASGTTASQTINCSVTTNDAVAQDVVAYLPHTSPLTSGTDTIPNSVIESSPAGTTWTSFADLTSFGLTGDDGARVATSVTIGDATAISFLVRLNIPTDGSVKVGNYSGTMTVEIVAHV